MISILMFVFELMDRVAGHIEDSLGELEETEQHVTEEQSRELIGRLK